MTERFIMRWMSSWSPHAWSGFLLELSATYWHRGKPLQSLSIFAKMPASSHIFAKQKNHTEKKSITEDIWPEYSKNWLIILWVSLKAIAMKNTNNRLKSWMVKQQKNTKLKYLPDSPSSESKSHSRKKAQHIRRLLILTSNCLPH